MVADNQPGASPDNVSWAGNQIEVNIFIYGYESVWLPASLLGQQDRLADSLFASTRHFEVQLHFNKGLAGPPEDRVAAARDTAINPAVLDAFALALIAGGDPHTSPGLLGHEPKLKLPEIRFLTPQENQQLTDLAKDIARQMLGPDWKERQEQRRAALSAKTVQQ